MIRSEVMARLLLPQQTIQVQLMASSLEVDIRTMRMDNIGTINLDMPNPKILHKTATIEGTLVLMVGRIKNIVNK